MSSYSLVATSDLHFTGPGISELAPFKQNNLAILDQIARVLDAKQQPRPTALLVAGDVTDNGTDDFWPPKKPSWPLVPLPFSDKPNEFLGYRRWRESASQYADHFYACRGNHDTYVPKPYLWRPFDYDQFLQNGGYYYSRHLFEDVYLLVLGREPVDRILKNYIPRRLRRLAGKRVILMFHYNVEDPNEGNWSDFFQDKKGFEQLIRPFRDQIVMLVMGHTHINHFGFWKPEWISDLDFKGYPYTIVAGIGLTFFSFRTGEMVPWFIFNPEDLIAVNGRTGETRKFLEFS